jgi:hypothetical protein
MTSSATSTDRPAPGRDTGFHPWHFFILLSMIGATAAVMLARDTHPVALLLLSAAVIASGLVALALHHAVAGFFSRDPAAPLPTFGQLRETLERDKALVLRSIKELEFDRAMGKIGERDFAEISTRLRARALSLMEQLDRAGTPETPGTPATGTPGTGPVTSGTPATTTCAACGTANDADARFCKQCGARVAAALLILLLLGGLPMAARAQTMPDPKEMSGVVLPVTDVPAGTVSVRVIRGTFANNIVDQPVVFTIDGDETRTVRTDASGRAQVADLRSGTSVRAATTVDGERLESQEAVIGQSGFRIMLVATDPEAAARAEEDKQLASGPAVTGMVVLGPESRVIAELADDQLNIFYILEVLNSARTPVDIGGPLIFDLPREARGATMLEGSTPQATANGPRVTVTGPFAPGTTAVQIAYVLPYRGGTARLVQRWPAPLQQTTVLVSQTGGLSISSPQIAQARDLSGQGQAVILGGGAGIPAGEALELEIAGLPTRVEWPRYLALSIAGVITLAGLWAAATARPRPRTA